MFSLTKKIYYFLKLQLATPLEAYRRKSRPPLPALFTFVFFFFFFLGGGGIFFGRVEIFSPKIFKNLCIKVFLLNKVVQLFMSKLIEALF